MKRLDYSWPDLLWLRCEQLSRKLPGHVVVQCLSKASRRVYTARIDHVFAKYTGKLSDHETAQFDIGWLTVWAAELAEAVNKRKRRRR